MKLIFRFIKPYRVAMWIALFFTFFELAFELYQPVIMATIIDEGIVAGNLSVVYTWGGLLLGLSFLVFIGGAINSFYGSKVSQGVGSDLRQALFLKIQEFAFQQFQRFPTSSLITRLTNDITQLQNFLYMSLRIALRAPLFIIGGLLMAYTVHVGLANILLMSVPFLFLITLWIMKKGIFYFQQVQRKLDSVNRVMRENLLSMRLVKAYVREDFEEQRFIKENSDLLDDNKRALRIMEMTMPILTFGMNAVILVILWFGHGQITTSVVQPGEIVAIINYATRIMFSFNVFSFLMMAYSRANVSGTRITEVLEETTVPIKSKEEATQKIKGNIDFKSVSFGYNSDLVLEDVTFSIQAGQMVGILGETGSGKSSLIQLIPRLYEPTKGNILVDGKDIQSYQLEDLRNQIGLVPQEAHLFTGTIKENIQWGKNDASFEEIIQAAKEAEIHDFIMTLPNGYETRIGQRGVNLSGGQKQRLSIARALVRRPSILLLDDSTSALDANTEERILKTIKKQSCTVLLIAQKISSVKGADQILLLQDGRVIACGDHERLLRANRFYQKIYASQSQGKVVEHLV